MNAIASGFIGAKMTQELIERQREKIAARSVAPPNGTRRISAELEYLLGDGGAAQCHRRRTHARCGGHHCVSGLFSDQALDAVFDLTTRFAPRTEFSAGISTRSRVHSSGRGFENRRVLFCRLSDAAESQQRQVRASRFESRFAANLAPKAKRSKGPKL
jgi:hypothetical protein